jgi:hypothetical protein
MQVKDLPIELNLYIHSFVDDFKEYYSTKVLPQIQQKVKTQLMNKVFNLVSKVKIQEAYEYVMDDNQFNYALVSKDILFQHFDQMWFMNTVRKNKSWNI